MNAHDYPDANPDSDLLTEEELPPEAGRCPKPVRRLIRNCHRNLGHPSNSALARLMVVAKCHPDIIAYATHMKCDVCARRNPPKRVPKATMPYRPTRFNDTVGIDLKWVKDAKGETFYLLNINISESIYYIQLFVKFACIQATAKRRLGLTKSIHMHARN